MNFFYFFIIIVVVLIVVLIKEFEPTWKGRAGESFVNRKLLQLDSAYYKILNDIMLPSRGNLNTTQIDHVVISNYGIFCIETKAYQGWIFGNANQGYWTQVIYRHKERFYNPLRQNYAHIKAVEDLLGSKYPNTKIISMVAFPSADKLEITGTDLVGRASDVVRKIKSFTYLIFSDTQRDEIYEILKNANIQDKEARKAHNKKVRNINNTLNYPF